MKKNTDKIFDEWLVLQYRSGHNKALSLLAKRWNQKIIRQAYWHTQNLDASKDIAQESWYVIVRRINGLRDPQRFGVWALSITSKKSIDWIRKNQKERKQEEDKRNAQEELNSSKDETVQEKIDIIRKAMKNLPDDHRMVLSLFYTESYSLKEISKIMRIPQGTVKSRLFNAREKLKNFIKEEVEL
jgi:RNA polymerase sigma factor (sigma-70 family)